MKKTLISSYYFIIIIIISSLNVSAEKHNVLRRGVSGDPTTLDPHKILTAFESTIMTDLFVALATTSAEDKIIPGSAESWTISEDGLKYTFKIRKNLK